MGEPSFYSHPSSEGCCLDFPEIIVILVALIIVVQLALKLAAVICYYLWYLIGVMFGMVVVQAKEKPKHTTTSKGKKIFAAKSKPSLHWSEEDIPRRRRRKESRSPSRRCLHCTLDPLKVTMNLKNDAPYRAGRHSYADYPPPHYYKYESDSRPRPRRASAPSAYAVTRFREASVGSSDPIMGASRRHSPERRSMATGTETAPPRQHAEEAEHQGRSRSRKPAKVYIYPVHPQTPPGSRSSSPGRSPRRQRRRRRALTSSQEDERATRAARRKGREAEQQTSPRPPMTLRYEPGSTNVAQRQKEPPTGKPRYYWSDQVSNADWVYRPVK